MASLRDFISKNKYLFNWIFLSVYALLEILLIVSVNYFGIEDLKLVVGIFVIAFLYFISIERLIMEILNQSLEGKLNFLNRRYFVVSFLNKELLKDNRRLKKDLSGLKK